MSKKYWFRFGEASTLRKCASWKGCKKKASTNVLEIHGFSIKNATQTPDNYFQNKSKKWPDFTGRAPLASLVTPLALQPCFWSKKCAKMSQKGLRMLQKCSHSVSKVHKKAYMPTTVFSDQEGCHRILDNGKSCFLLKVDGPADCAKRFQ